MEPKPLDARRLRQRRDNKVTEIPPTGRRSKQRMKTSKPPTLEQDSGSPVPKSDMLEMTK